MFSVPARFLFWGRLLFFFFFCGKKLFKKQEKYVLFFFSFFSEEKIACYIKIAFYIFRLPHQLFHLLWKLSRMSGGHLEKIGRPVVLENVSGGHLKKKKKNASSFLFSTEAGTLNMFCFFTSPYYTCCKCILLFFIFPLWPGTSWKWSELSKFNF